MATKTKTAPKAKAAAAPAPVVEATEETVFGVSDIAELIQVKTGKAVKTRDLRTLLRKMARDGRLNREIIAGNRERWTWTGPTDPEVDTIIDAFEAGELDEDKAEKLNALKERKAAQRAAKAAAAAEDEDEALEEE